MTTSITIEAKLLWQRILDGSQQCGLAITKPGRVIPYIGMLADDIVEAETRPVTFTLEAPQATHVSIAGDFNGWNTQTHPLENTPSGIWRISLQLLPGRYEYQFFIDGYWHNDPQSPRRVSNLFGTENDIIEVPAS